MSKLLFFMIGLYDYSLHTYCIKGEFCSFWGNPQKQYGLIRQNAEMPVRTETVRPGTKNNDFKRTMPQVSHPHNHLQTSVHYPDAQTPLLHDRFL